MKRIIIIWILFALLVGGAIFEEIYIKTSVNGLKERTEILEQQIIEEFNGEKALNTVAEMKEFWIKREKILCLVVNYKEIKEVLMQIYRLQETMQQNDEENTFIELEVLKYNVNGCSNIIGFNIQNVF